MHSGRHGEPKKLGRHEQMGLSSALGRHSELGPHGFGWHGAGRGGGAGEGMGPLRRKAEGLSGELEIAEEWQRMRGR